MRIFKQKVNSASVLHENKVIAEISAGYVFCLGVSATDSEECIRRTITDCLVCHSTPTEKNGSAETKTYQITSCLIHARLMMHLS